MESARRDQEATSVQIQGVKGDLQDSTVKINHRLDALSTQESNASVAIDKAMNPTQPPTEEAKLRQMRRAELQRYSLERIKTLRNWNAEFTTEDEARYSNITPCGPDEAMREKCMDDFNTEETRRENVHWTEYKNDYWGEAAIIYNELLVRYKAVGKAIPDPTSMMVIRMDVGKPLEGALNGTHGDDRSISMLVDYLDVMVRNLP